MTDPISDFFVRIVNAQAVLHKTVSFPFSKQKYRLAGILKENGLIDDFKKREKKGNKFIKIFLKYNGKIPVISGFKRLSKPSRRFYKHYSDLIIISGKYFIISTSRGIMTAREAKRRKLGGELMVQIW